MPIFGLFGAGGFGREVMPIARENGMQPYFVVSSPGPRVVNGVPVVSPDEFFELRADLYFNVAVSDTRERERIVTSFMQRGAIPLPVRARSTLVYDENKIGAGSIFCAYTYVTSNAQIGRFFHCNPFSYVSHDCVIGDYVTFTPRVSCSGWVVIGNHVYVGTGALIRNGAEGKPIVIGDGATIGMGAVVTADVPSGATVVGNPARVLRRSPPA
ncbi:MAG: putative capsular polysaccharide related hexapeptide transferase family protein [Betaproteobacteria bacterium]|nr:putative capsular polysaccharide related hexapeptide transferase family protein [Betaproteobacteria bacterium]